MVGRGAKEGGDEVGEEDGGLPVGEFGLADELMGAPAAGVEAFEKVLFCGGNLGEGDGDANSFKVDEHIIDVNMLVKSHAI